MNNWEQFLLQPKFHIYIHFFQVNLSVRVTPFEITEVFLLFHRAFTTPNWSRLVVPQILLICTMIKLKSMFSKLAHIHTHVFYYFLTNMRGYFSQSSEIVREDHRETWCLFLKHETLNLKPLEIYFRKSKSWLRNFTRELLSCYWLSRSIITLSSIPLESWYRLKIKMKSAETL